MNSVGAVYFPRYVAGPGTEVRANLAESGSSSLPTILFSKVKARTLRGRGSSCPHSRLPAHGRARVETRFRRQLSPDARHNSAPRFGLKARSTQIHRRFGPIVPSSWWKQSHHAWRFPLVEAGYRPD